MDKGAYGHLLLAVDFEKASEPVVARAEGLRRLMDARLTLLHVVEHVPPTMETLYLGYSGEIAMPESRDLEEELMQVARQQMDGLADQLGVGPADRLIRVGATGHVIDTVAEELGVDLVIIGSHGRHGLLGLFGSTARSVLRRSSCDLLCVKIDEQAA